MLLYRAVLHKALVARMVHTTACDFRQRGPQYDAGMEMLVKSLKLPEDKLDNLNYDDVEDMLDQSANSVDAALHTVPEDLKQEKSFIKGKMIEQKFFRDLYKIKPGEVYNRNKDPFFKRGRDIKDFHHRHHNSIRREAILAEKSPKSIPIDDVLTQTKYQHNPLNPLSSIESNDAVVVTRTSSKYASVKPSLSSPEEAYHSSSSNPDSAPVTGKSILFTERRAVSDYSFKVPKLIAAAGKESEMRPMEEEPSSEESFSDYDGPCLMLWSMKEQMRYLHGTDPLHWSPEMLSTVFPVSPVNAKKLLKSRWVPEDDHELAKHDRRVLDHWKELSGGRLRNHALVTKAIQNRLETANEPVSGLPVPSAINDQMMDILDKLQFEHPEQAKQQGVSPVKRQFVDPPEYGFFSDIIKNYKAKVDALHNNSVDGDKASTPDLYSSELDVVATLPSPPSYEGRTVAVRGVATSQGAAIERLQRAVSSCESQNNGPLFNRPRLGVRANSQRSSWGEEKEQPQRPRLLDARPGLERLKLMEEEGGLDMGVSRGHDRGRHDRPHNNDEAVSDARPRARHHVIEKGARKQKTKGKPHHIIPQAVNMITYDQFVQQSGKQSLHQGNKTNKKQDAYFDRKDFKFLFSNHKP